MSTPVLGPLSFGSGGEVGTLDAISVKGSNIASATTTNIAGATGDFVDITGTTTITGLGTAAAGVERTVHFTGALTLTHNATSLILPGGANIVTVAGDIAVFRSLGSGNWRCIDYSPVGALPVNRGGTGVLDGNIVGLNFVIDGGGATLTTGVKGYVRIPFACTVLEASLLADQSGSVVVDIWKDTYANFPPVSGDKITASAPPTIASTTKSTDTTLTGWTTSIAAGDVLGFNVNSVTTIQRVTLYLKLRRA